MRWAFTLWNKSSLSREDFEALRKAGYSLAEVSLDYPWPYSGDFPGVVAEIKGLGLDLAFHAPWRDIQLASPYPEVSRASLEALKKVIDKVGDYAPVYIVFHLQTREEVELSEEYVSSVKGVVSELGDYARSRGIRPLLENTFGGLSESPELFVDIMKSAGLGACLDVGRLLPRDSYGNFSLDTIERWIKAVGDRIETLHLHTVGRRKGRVTEHFSFLGSETLFSMIVKRARSYNPNLIVTIEVFYTHTGNDATAPYLADMLSKFLTQF